MLIKNKIGKISVVSLIIIVLTLMICFFVNVTAGTSDNTKELIKNASTSSYGIIEIKNISGAKIETLELTENTVSCSENCFAIKTIVLYKDKDGKATNVLFDKVKFMTINPDGSRTEQSIRSYKFYYSTIRTEKTVDDFITNCSTKSYLPNGTAVMECKPIKIGKHIEYSYSWQDYNYELLLPGTYYLKLEGSKKPTRIVDWIITAQEIELTDWAVWGSGNYTQNEPFVSGTTNSDIYDMGQAIKTGNFNITLMAVGIAGNSLSVRIMRNDTGGVTLLKSVSTSGNTGLFNIVLNASTVYMLATDAASAAHAWYLNTTDQNYNRSFTDFPSIQWVASWDSSGTGNNFGTSWKEVKNITYSVSGSTIILNSPVDGYNSTSNNISTFNCSATVVGTTLVNMSLIDNSTGTMAINQTNNVIGTTNMSIFSNSYNNGKYLWSCRACDADSDCGYAASNRTITVDAAISLNIVYPTNTTYNVNVSELNYTITNSSVLSSCWYSINNGSTNTTITCGNNVTSLTSLEGTNIWKIWANDTTNNVNVSTVTFFKDTIGPAVDLNYPNDNSYLNYKNKVYFNYTATSSTLERCDLYSTWKTGSWIINYTWISPNSDVMNYTILNLTDGSYKWSVYCNDSLGNIGVALTNRSLTVDTIYPQINLSSPPTTVGSQTISITSNESDINIQSCKFSIYDSLGNVNGLNNNVSFVGGCNTTQNATVTDYATYDLVVYALDKAGNENSSSVSFTTIASSDGTSGGGGASPTTNVTLIRVFAVVQPFEDRGTYTNLTRAIIYTVLKKYIEKNDYRLAFLTDSRSIEISNILLNNYSVNITSSLMNFWYVNFINKNVDEFLIEESYVNKYGLVGEYLTIIAGDFRIVDPLLNPGTSIVNAFFMRECMGGNNIWRFEVKANKIINECYFKEEGFNCEIDNSSKSIARFSSYINSTNKFIFSNSGEAVLRDQENNTIYQGVVINTYNLCYNFKIVKFKIYAFLLFIVILAIIIVFIIAFKRGYRIKWI